MIKSRWVLRKYSCLSCWIYLNIYIFFIIWWILIVVLKCAIGERLSFPGRRTFLIEISKKLINRLIITKGSEHTQLCVLRIRVGPDKNLWLPNRTRSEVIFGCKCRACVDVALCEPPVTCHYGALHSRAASLPGVTTNHTRHANLCYPLPVNPFIFIDIF